MKALEGLFTAHRAPVGRSDLLMHHLASALRNHIQKAATEAGRFNLSLQATAYADLYRRMDALNPDYEAIIDDTLAWVTSSEQTLEWLETVLALG